MGKKVKFYQYDNNGHSFKQISGLDDMIAVSLEFFENFKKEEYYEDKKDNIK